MGLTGWVLFNAAGRVPVPVIRNYYSWFCCNKNGSVRAASIVVTGIAD